MTDAVMIFLAFACGGFVGFISAAFFAVGKRASDAHDFDGGFAANNPPPVRTRVWSDHVKTENKN